MKTTKKGPFYETPSTFKILKYVVNRQVYERPGPETSEGGYVQ